VTAQRRKKILRHGGPAVWGGAWFLFAGWAIVLYEPLIFPAILKSGAGPLLPEPGHYLPIIGQSAIITGIGLALFGLAVHLMRLLMKLASLGPPAIRPASAQAQTFHFAEHVKPVHVEADRGQNRFIPPVQRRAARDPAREVITRGALNGRGYVLFRDGSVVIETLLGPKRFGSMTDAQDFIAAK
jgi:hypothetical protein